MERYTLYFLLLVPLCSCKPLAFYEHRKFIHKSPDFLNEHEIFKRHILSEVGNCPPHPVPQELPSTLPVQISNALDQLSKLGDASVDKTAVPGVIMSLTYMGKTIWTKGFGLKNKSKPDLGPPGESDIFRIGSVSKVFPVLMTYQLYASKLIDSLDDPLVKYNPQFKIVDPYSKDGKGLITIRQMASQLSGLQREAPCANRTVENMCPQTTEEMLKLLSSEILIHPSWTEPSYSNLAYALLGRLLVDQFHRGLAFEDYVQRSILGPLGLKNTGFTITDDVKSKMAVGYNPDGSEAALTDLGWISPAGQMYSTIEDLNKLSEFFYQAHLLPNNNGPVNEDVLSATLRREMSLPLFVNPDAQTGFGTPWEIMYRGNYTIRTKGGNVGGYSALFSFVPELHLGINALFSGSFDEFGFAASAYDIVLSPFVNYLKQNPPGIGFPPNPDAYVGNYSYEGNGAMIFAKENVMYASFLGTTYFLNYREENKMQIYYPEYLLPCMENALSAAQGEWLYFDSNYKSGKSPGFTLPGLFLDSYIKRV